jgi:pimeloyl-ACP methyl ester carboxylesterase
MPSHGKNGGKGDVLARIPTFADLFAYQVDAWQRGVLFLDVMRRREEQSREHAAQAAPNVLEYRAELVCDGRTLARPVNYLLVRIVPPEGVTIDPRKRPFVVVDPRAGHGPGIGGFKADSEIGVAMKAGHPCYFVGFLPDPVPGQTIEDIALAEARFLEIVIDRHPEAEGRPCVIGNCQAGWAMMMVDALRPELFGPIIVAGSPLSYWAGVKGQYPMRYSGGLLGGSWLTALTGDMGAGVFDGAWLVQNFENQNPANTLWSKQYNLWSEIDTEAERYLGFEKWWGGHVNLNAEEIQWIVDELFVGNKLAAGEIRTSDGTAIDLRNIRSPIVVFCSRGDNITPPQQALDWILDLYDSVDEIRAHGQTIVYAIHDKIGHLGIFVSAGVAKKEHDEFASNIDFIDVLPPGLYEAILEPRGEAVDHPELVTGNWVMRCEERTLDDIRALGGNDLADERRFAAAARLSEINLALYRAFAQPLVRAMVTPPLAEALKRMHPLRLQSEIFGPRNPFALAVQSLAETVRAQRQPAAPDNPFLALQERMSEQIVESLETFRKTVEKSSEEAFLALYGKPGLQAALGIDTTSDRRPRKAAKNLQHRALVERRIAELKAAMRSGGLPEALLRSLVYVGMARGAPDERAFEALRRLRQRRTGPEPLPLPAFKALVREQYFMLRLDQEAALAAIPGLLPPEMEERQNALDMLQQVLTARGPLEEEGARRLARITTLFEVTDSAPREAEAEAEAPEPSAPPEVRTPRPSGTATSVARRASRRPSGPQIRH